LDSGGCGTILNFWGTKKTKNVVFFGAFLKVAPLSQFGVCVCEGIVKKIYKNLFTTKKMQLFYFWAFLDIGAANGCVIPVPP
jgi:hypothetical protein